MIRKYLRFYGFVQGVGFRYRAKYAAEFAGAVGWVRNEDDGSVSMEIQGTEAQIDRVILEIEQGRYVKIENMEVRPFRLRKRKGAFGYDKSLLSTERPYFLTCSAIGGYAIVSLGILLPKHHGNSRK